MRTSVWITYAAAVVVALVVLVSPSIQAQSGDNAKYLGIWLRAERDREIEIAPCAERAGAICATIVRVMDPATGQPLTGKSALGKDGTPLIGTAVLQLCAPARSGLRCARAYIPTTGESHSDVGVTIERDGRLKIGGWLGASYWTRVK